MAPPGRLACNMTGKERSRSVASDVCHATCIHKPVLRHTLMKTFEMEGFRSLSGCLEGSISFSLHSRYIKIIGITFLLNKSLEIRKMLPLLCVTLKQIHNQSYAN